MNMHTASE